MSKPLAYGKYYHIYNRGINGENIFREADNYEHFLNLYDRYIEPVAGTFAWALMSNHFHLLVRIKEVEEIGYFLKLHSFNSDRSDNSVRLNTNNKWKTSNLLASAEPDRITNKKPNPSSQFSHLFNAYTKYYNKRYNRHGSLFERPFRRKIIYHSRYFQQLVVYIHNNPVYHGFTEDPIEYPWTSYLTIISIKPTKLKREAVIGWFDSLGNYKSVHQQQKDNKTIENYTFGD